MDPLHPYLEAVLNGYQRCLRAADVVSDEAQADARYAGKRARDLCEDGDVAAALSAAEEAAADDPQWQPLLEAVQRCDRADRAVAAAEEDADSLRAAGADARVDAWSAAAERHGLAISDDELRTLYLRELDQNS